jgi:hypothetical protein
VVEPLFEVGHEPRDEHDVDGRFADHRIGDVDPVVGQRRVNIR